MCTVVLFYLDVFTSVSEHCCGLPMLARGIVSPAVVKHCSTVNGIDRSFDQHGGRWSSVGRVVPRSRPILI